MKLVMCASENNIALDYMTYYLNNRTERESLISISLFHIPLKEYYQYLLAHVDLDVDQI